MIELIKDPYFKVITVASTPNPQQLCWLAAHQDYSENAVWDVVPPAESKAGELIIKNCLKSGHWGIVEHPQLTVNAVGFSHTVMQQLRTHRINVSFDVQSGRYTGNRVLDVVDSKRTIEEVFYFRPVGLYTDRQGHKYEYTESMRELDKSRTYDKCIVYKTKINSGFSEEDARDDLPYRIRQNFVLSVNARSGAHMCSVRGTADVQLECRTFAHMLLDCLCDWMPEVYGWYKEHKFGKNNLTA